MTPSKRHSILILILIVPISILTFMFIYKTSHHRASKAKRKDELPAYSLLSPAHLAIVLAYCDCPCPRPCPYVPASVPCVQSQFPVPCSPFWLRKHFSDP